MGHKVNPVGLRVGINRTWDSRRYASRGEYGKLLHEDIALRNFVSPREYARRSAAAARVHLQVIERAARAAGVPCQTLHAASSFPHDEIVRTAQKKKCDAIFMASHGRRGIARLLLGSEASKVIALSKVPVIISR